MRRRCCTNFVAFTIEIGILIWPESCYKSTNLSLSDEPNHKIINQFSHQFRLTALCFSIRSQAECRCGTAFPHTKIIPHHPAPNHECCAAGWHHSASVIYLRHISSSVFSLQSMHSSTSFITQIHGVTSTISSLSAVAIFLHCSAVKLLHIQLHSLLHE